jgi:hypothetical protein
MSNSNSWIRLRISIWVWDLSRLDLVDLILMVAKRLAGQLLLLGLGMIMISRGNREWDVKLGNSVIICCMHRQSFIGKEGNRRTEWSNAIIHLMVWCWRERHRRSPGKYRCPERNEESFPTSHMLRMVNNRRRHSYPSRTHRQ